MAFRPRDPKTGPMGGEGEAWPAGQMNLTSCYIGKVGGDLFRLLLLCLFVLTWWSKVDDFEGDQENQIRGNQQSRRACGREKYDDNVGRNEGQSNSGLD
jgi:hypothetical protein